MVLFPALKIRLKFCAIFLSRAVDEMCYDGLTRSILIYDIYGKHVHEKLLKYFFNCWETKRL